MSKPEFGKRSLAHIATLHPDLKIVLIELMNETTRSSDDFAVICGLRNKEDQEHAYATKKSNAPFPKSYHNGSYDEDGAWMSDVSDAFDAIPYPIEWPDKKTDSPHEYIRKMARIWKLAERIMTKAHELGIELEWGGMFKSWFDGPHYQRVRK